MLTLNNLSINNQSNTLSRQYSFRIVSIPYKTSTMISESIHSTDSSLSTLTTTSDPSSSQPAKPVRVGAIEDRMKSRLEYLQRKAAEKKRLKKEQRLAKEASSETRPADEKKQRSYMRKSTWETAYLSNLTIG